MHEKAPLRRSKTSRRDSARSEPKWKDLVPQEGKKVRDVERNPRAPEKRVGKQQRDFAVFWGKSSYSGGPDGNDQQGKTE